MQEFLEKLGVYQDIPNTWESRLVMMVHFYCGLTPAPSCHLILPVIPCGRHSFGVFLETGNWGWRSEAVAWISHTVIKGKIGYLNSELSIARICFSTTAVKYGLPVRGSMVSDPQHCAKYMKKRNDFECGTCSSDSPNVRAGGQLYLKSQSSLWLRFPEAAVPEAAWREDSVRGSPPLDTESLLKPRCLSRTPASELLTLQVQVGSENLNF